MNKNNQNVINIGINKIGSKLNKFVFDFDHYSQNEIY